MNRINVQRTIDVLRAPLPVGLNMGMWVENHEDGHTYACVAAIPDTLNCRTTACIAGHIAIAFRDEMDLNSKTRISEAAQQFLNLNDGQADHLFYGHFRDMDKIPHLGDVTVDQVIAELERMLKDA